MRIIIKSHTEAGIKYDLVKTKVERTQDECH